MWKPSSALLAVERCTLMTTATRIARLRTLEGTSIPHVTQKQIRGVLDSNKFRYSVGHASFVLQCPFCGGGSGGEKRTSSGSSGRRTMFVNKTTGGVVCKPCDVKGEETRGESDHPHSLSDTGSWLEFLSWVTKSKGPGPTSSKTLRAVPPSDERQLASRRVAQEFWSSTTAWEDTPASVLEEIMKVFGIKVSCI